MIKKIPKKTKYIYMTCPVELVEYFEKQAREEIEDDGTEVNQVLLSRMRNDLMISAMQAAIIVYEDIGR